MLSQAPNESSADSGFTWQLSVGSFMGAAWVAPSYRENVFRLKDDPQNPKYFAYTTPIIGPVLTAVNGGSQGREDQWLLFTSAALQCVGLGTLVYRLTQYWAQPSTRAQAQRGLSLDIGTFVAGRLGISLTLTGW